MSSPTEETVGNRRPERARGRARGRARFGALRREVVVRLVPERAGGSSAWSQGWSGSATPGTPKPRKTKRPGRGTSGPHPGLCSPAWVFLARSSPEPSTSSQQPQRSTPGCDGPGHVERARVARALPCAGETVSPDGDVIFVPSSGPFGQRPETHRAHTAVRLPPNRLARRKRARKDCPSRMVGERRLGLLGGPRSEAMERTTGFEPATLTLAR